MYQETTLDALSASDLLLREREQQEKEQHEREQQGKSGLNRIKNNNYINSRNQTRPESSMDLFSSLLVLIPFRIILFLLIFYNYPKRN